MAQFIFKLRYHIPLHKKRYKPFNTAFFFFFYHVLIMALLESPHQYTQFNCCCHHLACVSPAEQKVKVHVIFKDLLFLWHHNLFAQSLPVAFIGINLTQIWVYQAQTFYVISQVFRFSVSIEVFFFIIQVSNV